MKKFMLLSILVLVGCNNFSQISKHEKACFPDGSCTFISTYLHGGVVAGKQIVVVNVKECHQGTKNHTIIKGSKKHEGKWHCTRGQKTVHVGDGMAEKMFSGSVNYTRHGGKPYAEGDTFTNSSSLDSNTRIRLPASIPKEPSH